jgi:hypothetical protein
MAEIEFGDMHFCVSESMKQFSSRPSLVHSVTVVLLSLVTGGRGGEGRLAKPGAGLIQPLCRRDGHGRPGCQGGKPEKNLARRLLAGAEARSSCSRMPTRPAMS